MNREELEKQPELSALIAKAERYKIELDEGKLSKEEFEALTSQLRDFDALSKKAEFANRKQELAEALALVEEILGYLT